MQCKGCSVLKLSNEFPWRQVTSSCCHRPAYCIRCVLKHLETTSECPQCACVISDQDTAVLSARLRLVTHEDKFAQKETATTNTNRDESAGFSLTVSMLSGESARFKAYGTTTIRSLLKSIESTLKIDPQYQRLMYNGTEIKVVSEGKATTLAYYCIGEGSVLQLMRLLLAIPRDSALNQMKFVLSWGWPGKRAFMDGSCFAFCGRSFYSVVNYRTKGDVGKGFAHSGAAYMDAHNETGQQVISVMLDKLRRDITHLFFVLSACRVKTLAEFPYTDVQLFDLTDPSKKLIPDYKLRSIGDCQAIVMCCLTRSEDEWRVVGLGQRTEGSVYFTAPLLTTIQHLFAIV